MAAMMPQPAPGRLGETRLRGWVDPYAGLAAFDFARHPPPSASASHRAAGGK
ncbi:hypothetical protein OUY22_13720 [Nonomuraea sp. MCN248]|uniref:Uncharacterized protein n=1 Tax=Nonomuraea corallina TaxID=2989783 RepID=A0ABT4SB92_9ACTN|nr:hypothetical protein [Nonomuraea corallina]MDA0634478.1 hypothetical protein [Nonomuraea corallina]